MMFKQCDMCETEFHVMPYQIKSGRGKHCSRKCYELSKRGKPSWNKGLPAPWSVGNKWRLGLKNPHISELNKSRIGHLNVNWKGDEVGYRGVHYWLTRRLGKPTKCEHCGIDGLSGRKIHWANISQKYLRDITDWIRLCAKCHKGFDSGKLQIRGQ